MKAIRVTGQTLVGSYGEFPRRGGNCFSVATDDEKYYNIVNFKVENLEELFRRKIIEWPIEIECLEGNTAIITDKRIPSDWFTAKYCEVCCPKKLWTQQQKDDWQAKIDSGEIEERNGLIIYKLKTQPRQLKAGWSSVEGKSEIFVGDSLASELTDALSKQIDSSRNE